MSVTIELKNLRDRLRVNRKFSKWFRPFLFSLIFIGVFLLLYISLQTAITRTINRNNDDFTLQVEHASDIINQQIVISITQFFYTSSIRQLRTMTSYNPPLSAIGQVDLENFVGSNDFIDSVMIYNQNLGIIFTSNGRFSYSFEGRYGFYDSGALELLSRTEDSPYLTPIKRYIGEELYYSFLFYERAGTQSGVLLLNVSARRYAANILNGFSSGYGIILDDQWQLIAYSDARQAQQVLRTKPEFDVWGNLNVRQASFPFFSNSEVWLYHRLDDFGLYCLNILRLNDVAPGLLYMRNLFIVCLIVLGVLVLFVIFHLLAKGYFLYSRIQDAIHHPDGVSGNSSLHLHEMLDDKIEKEHLKKIRRLRNGLLQTDFEFPILIVRADVPFGALRSKFVRAYPGAAIADDSLGSIAAIPSCTEQKLEEICRYLSEETGATLYFSNLCYSTEHLRLSFAALDELRSLRFLYSDKKIMREEMLRECNHVSALDTKNVSALVSFLREGQLEPALDEWHIIFNDIRKDRFAGFCFSMQYIEGKLDALCSELMLERSALCDNILGNIQSTDLLYNHMEILFAKITRAAFEQKCAKLEKLTGIVDEYIREHHEDEMLSAQQIADHLNMSLAYLSQQFRKAAKMSIGDAIHSVRIEKARLLLRNTNDPVELVAKRSGYPNSKYFFVLFKKLEGVTPSQFRKTSQL